MPIVQDFEDVFQEISGLPLKREIDFYIELVPRTSPTEMQELKKQVQKLETLGFVRPSTSPWGALVLFVKRKDET